MELYITSLSALSVGKLHSRILRVRISIAVFVPPTRQKRRNCQKTLRQTIPVPLVDGAPGDCSSFVSCNDCSSSEHSLHTDSFLMTYRSLASILSLHRLNSCADEGRP